MRRTNGCAADVLSLVNEGLIGREPPRNRAAAAALEAFGYASQILHPEQAGVAAAAADGAVPR